VSRDTRKRREWGWEGGKAMECVRASEWTTPALVDIATSPVTITAPIPLACRATLRESQFGSMQYFGNMFSQT
jgi:hypothetical protein